MQRVVLQALLLAAIAAVASAQVVILPEESHYATVAPQGYAYFDIYLRGVAEEVLKVDVELRSECRGGAELYVSATQAPRRDAGQHDVPLDTWSGNPDEDGFVWLMAPGSSSSNKYTIGLFNPSAGGCDYRLVAYFQRPTLITAFGGAQSLILSADMNVTKWQWFQMTIPSPESDMLIVTFTHDAACSRYTSAARLGKVPGSVQGLDGHYDLPSTRRITEPTYTRLLIPANALVGAASRIWYFGMKLDRDAGINQCDVALSTRLAPVAQTVADGKNVEITIPAQATAYFNLTASLVGRKLSFTSTIKEAGDWLEFAVGFNAIPDNNRYDMYLTCKSSSGLCALTTTNDAPTYYMLAVFNNDLDSASATMSFSIESGSTPAPAPTPCEECPPTFGYLSIFFGATTLFATAAAAVFWKRAKPATTEPDGYAPMNA